MDPDPDPAIFVIDLQDAKKKLIKKKFCLLLFEGTGYIYIIFNDKKSKSNKAVGIKDFFYYFCLLIE